MQHGLHTKAPPRRGDEGESIDFDSLLNGDDKAREPRIRCPKCRWQPSRHDRWQCACFHVWNTFDTGGRCPACTHEWRDTQCLRCKKWSPHEAWYEK